MIDPIIPRDAPSERAILTILKKADGSTTHQILLRLRRKGYDIPVDPRKAGWKIRPRLFVLEKRGRIFVDRSRHDVRYFLVRKPTDEPILPKDPGDLPPEPDFKTPTQDIVLGLDRSESISQEDFEAEVEV